MYNESCVHITRVHSLPRCYGRHVGDVDILYWVLKIHKTASNKVENSTERYIYQIIVSDSMLPV